MKSSNAYIAWRLLPVALVTVAAGFWFNDVQSGSSHVLRNLVPLAVLIGFAWLTLHRGGGRWSGSGMKMPLGTLGYAIPALGLSLYIHYAYAVNLNDMFSDARHPERIFRYLPVYTMGAGLIGFAIGWIVGRNV